MKSVLKRDKTLAFFFALILVFNLVIANPLFSFKSSASMETETESQSEGFEFGNANTYFDMERPIKPGGSMTFEAVTTLPENSNASRLGWLIGNWESYDLESNSFGIEFQANRVIRLFLCSGKKVNTSIQFDLPEENSPGTYRKICFVMNVNGDVSFYVDDIHIGTKNTTLVTGSNYYNQVTPIRIGGDLRSGNSWYLRDLKVKSIAMYKGVPSTDATDSSKITTEGLDAMFSYDLTDTSVTGYITDLSGNNNNAINPNTYKGSMNLEGYTFNASNYFDMEEPINPNGSMTFEALMTLPENSNIERLGWVVGNYIDFGKKEFGVELQANRKIRVFLCKGGGSKYSKSVQFSLPEENAPGTYRKIAFVMNMNGDVSFYVDNALIETQNIASFVGTDNSFYNQVTPFRIGGDYRGGNSWYLRDIKVKSVAMYKGVPSADATDSSKITTEGLDAMFSYDLTDTSVAGYLADLSGNCNHAINDDTYDSSLAYDYSFAIIGDTQYMTRWDAAQLNGVQNSTEHLKKVYDWLLANKERKNIKYVMGLGDITDSYNKSYSSVSSEGYGFDTAKEWEIAYGQISRLDGIIPYSVVRGNHDNETYFDNYFVNNYYKSQFKDPDYSDNSVCFYEQDSVLNAYTKFEIGTEKYMLILLDDNPTDAMLEWAGAAIKRNPDYRVIINTHTYLGYTGDLIDDSELYSYATGNVKDGENNGQQMWDKLVSKHENIVMVLCGHDYKSTNILRKERIGDNGNVVTELLICPQSLDKNQDVDPKSGMVAMFYFSNGGKDIRVEYISTAASLSRFDKKDIYHKAETNNTKFSIMNNPVPSKYGYISYEYRDAEAYPFAVFDENGGFIKAFASFMDCESSYDNDGAVYGAKDYMAANVWDGSSYGDNPRSAIILLRRDYSMASNETYNNISQVQGVLKIDLDGYTLTVHDKKPLIPSTVKPWSVTNDAAIFKTQFDFVDGNIKMGASPLITFSANAGSNNIDVSDKECIYNFTGIKFIASASASSLFAKYVTSDTPEAVANTNLNFNNCTFDFTEIQSGAVIFNLGDGLVHTTVMVNGGEIIANHTDFVMSEKNEASIGTLTFGKLEGENYTALTLPSGAEAPTAEYNGLVFVKISDNGETITYRQRPAEVAELEFVPKMSLTLDRDLILNVYVPAKNFLNSFTIDGVDYTDLAGLKKVTLGAEDYYLVSISLDAKSAARDVVLRAKVAIGDKTASATFTFGLIKYAEKILAVGSAPEETLVRDVLSYVRAAYVYFKTDDAASVAKINAILGDAYDADNAPETEGSATAETSGLKSATFVLDGTPAMRFYLADGADASKYAFFIDGIRVKTETSADGKYIDIDVYAYALCETVTYTVDGVEAGSFHIRAYYEWSKTQNNDNLTNLVARFWKYLQSARVYRDSVVEG